MCCNADPKELAKIRKARRIRTWCYAWKSICRDGRAWMATYYYKPGWNYARDRSGGRWLGQYDQAKPRGCHAQRSRGLLAPYLNAKGTEAVRVKVYYRDIVAASKKELVARKVRISKADWKKAGMDEPKRKKA